MIISDEKLKEKYNLLFPHLDERTKRMVCAADAKAIGHGGITRVKKASGLYRMTISKGKKELESQNSADSSANEIKNM